MESKINQCKKHNIPMELDGYENDYRVYSCKLCDLEEINKELGNEGIKELLKC